MPPFTQPRDVIAILGQTLRDWTLTVDAIEGKIIDHPAQRWSTQKLNNNELMLLLGLAVQSNSARIYSVLPTDDVFASEADRILRELHDRIIADAVPGPPPPEAALNPELLVGNMAREAIYYGADGFYQHQFKKFARHRYRNDQPWMLKNVGVSINPIIEIATYISGRVAANMNFIAHQKLEGNNQTAGDLTNSLLVGKSELRKRFGGKVDAFLAKFTTPAFNTNSDFTDPFSVNQVSIAPLIDLGDVLYVPSQYILLKSVYESPFYWMIADKAYAPKSSTHRGEFLEKTVAVILEKIFGQDNVYTNVTLYDGKNIGGEIDVLVRYGEFVIEPHRVCRRPFGLSYAAMAGSLTMA